MSRNSAGAALCAAFVLILCIAAPAQKPKPTAGKKPAAKTAVSGPAITIIDAQGLKKAITPSGKPLLVNFWATWCDPCRDEFPDLVKLSDEYKGRLDIITISLDDVEDVKTVVPKFLTQMKAQMPAYLLSTQDEDAAITMVSKDWAGNLPMTVLYKADGTTAYTRSGILRYKAVVDEIEKVLAQ